jgi:DNA-binding response OmpR family regulator
VSGVLLIEDDAELRRALRLSLEDVGFTVHEAATGAQGISGVRTLDPDVVLLDLRLPDLHGFDVCRELRAQGPVPIIIVTAHDDPHDLVAGLEAGADDYVTKPVHSKGLTARIRALLRRVALDTSPEPVVRLGPVEVNRAEGVVRRDGEPLALTKTEYRLLCAFLDRPSQVLSRVDLLRDVWGYEYAGDGRLVDSHIRRLRTKVERDPERPDLIVTVRGLGYRLDPP